ncbi:VOC family protein [Haliangium ochraceum]|uniref:Glyoxalase/bleomycin resistance protein/dioxygenase n=1 Tax=Haliangium ochraceum (strain DSM 14365 / JCM 11303 / SMP-2) TaxID=502025 RepID=D0LKA1_HALO1|nr:VOC family protein [Haliangium ochraceum]ACY13135.1 Glyoxalase/bleomycin resistance protein/dioxygenase [Haliangium ochraceum DSM 14365]
MKPNLTHIARQVRDMSATVAFFEEFCGMRVVHERSDGSSAVVWMAEPGRERSFVLVLLSGGEPQAQAETDYGHLGFALGSRAEVDALAARAEQRGCLVWAPRQEAYPVGYYCGVRDPDGQFVEFSYGQPLGPGAPPLDTEAP